jgi:hypothetical protein
MTFKQLEKRLRARLKQVQVLPTKAKDLAGISDYRTQTIHLNPVNGALLETLLHELLHLELRLEFNPFGRELEECCVLALADGLVRHINRSKARHAWWVKKLNELAR